MVGAGPNGLAAVELARNGRSVALLEAEDTIGGGARSTELTLPGFVASTLAIAVLFSPLRRRISRIS